MDCVNHVSLDIITLTREEMGLPLDWATAEGWNPGLGDGDIFHNTDPGGFLVGRLGEEAVAVISAVTYDEAFGFIGLYIVKPEYRGRGYGMAMWRAALARLGSRNIGLDGVLAHQEDYRRSGFVWAHGNLRYRGVGGGEMPTGVVELETVPFGQVVAYDSALFGQRRETFLRGWLRHGGKAVIKDDRLLGYGVIRPCRHGYKIAPLFADDPETAERLLRALVAGLSGQVFFLDPPRPHDMALALAERYGMTPVFETARMYTRGDPGLPLQRIYGITSFELG
ncbi:MAG: GNAT family N-acetyltransferase [Magnetococcales bacterium]|nr:GNAT family N-acetyltransferase [Magnetococcales bacterium]